MAWICGSHERVLLRSPSKRVPVARSTGGQQYQLQHFGSVAILEQRPHFSHTYSQSMSKNHGRSRAWPCLPNSGLFCGQSELTVRPAQTSSELYLFEDLHPSSSFLSSLLSQVVNLHLNLKIFFAFPCSLFPLPFASNSILVSASPSTQVDSFMQKC